MSKTTRAIESMTAEIESKVDRAKYYHEPIKVEWLESLDLTVALDRIESLESENAELEDERDDAESERDEAMKEARAAETKCDELENKIYNLERENEELKETLIEQQTGKSQQRENHECRDVQRKSKDNGARR